ncbi:hypothetical protein [Bradyrhizobium sp. Mp27]|uniref:hypothetical protein n=1 Tax=Bradyrhizobium sp. Mp27 TaxID=3042157 RepID=UPI00248B0569|nr:hypothetical protein [Bradyrhizobium sp. Mp27]MDI2075168.1 hypothetical protein [Bradyrhizobium sp. Mp27]
MAKAAPMLGSAGSIMSIASGFSAMMDAITMTNPVGRSKSPGYGHLKLPHLMIAVSAAEQQ